MAKAGGEAGSMPQLGWDELRTDGTALPLDQGGKQTPRPSAAAAAKQVQAKMGSKARGASGGQTVAQGAPSPLEPPYQKPGPLTAFQLFSAARQVWPDLGSCHAS